MVDNCSVEAGGSAKLWGAGVSAADEIDTAGAATNSTGAAISTGSAIGGGGSAL
jgi:hypothetical protein